jgi:signal transduction histidine kinase
MSLHYPYRERTERVVAFGRLLLALFSFLAIWLDQTQPTRFATAGYSLLGVYLFYAGVVGLIAWRTHRPLRGFQLGTHVFDLAAFVAIMYFTEGATSPFFVYFVFALVVATLRWRSRGAILTAVGALVAFAVLGFVAHRALPDPEFQLSRFIVRAVYLGVVTILLTQFERFEQAVRSELERLARWRRSSAADLEALLRSSLPEAVQIIGARRALLVWDETEAPSRFVAYAGQSGVEFSREAPGTFGDLVPPQLAEAAFISFSKPRLVIQVRDGKMRSTQGEAIDSTLRSAFSITDFVSVPLVGEDFRGRLFLLEHPAAIVDSLFLGEIIGSELVSRIEGVRLLTEIQHAAALNQRMATAGDLHDGLLQSLTAVGLELATISQRLPRELTEIRAGLKHAEDLISGERRDLRALIDDMRPGQSPNDPFDLSARLASLPVAFRDRWELSVTVEAGSDALAWCAAASAGFSRQVYLLAHEGLVNVARHARASTARLSISTSLGGLRLVMSDDGQGFPEAGRYSLEMLERMEVRPLALCRRVRSLGGDLVLDSSDRGSRIDITLPVVHP